MAVFVDDAAIMYRSKPRFHLAADSVEELHAFCAKVGINRCWFHNARGHPHYDVTAPQREAAIAAGAEPLTMRELSYRTESGQRNLLRALELYKDDEAFVREMSQYIIKKPKPEDEPGYIGELF
jgi:hypothetical protein